MTVKYSLEEIQDMKQKGEDNPDRLAYYRKIENMHAQKPLVKFVTYGSFGIEKVECKLCDKVLREMAPDDRHRERRTINGKSVLVERLALKTLNEYVEIKMHFDDGSNHVTAICKQCANSIKNNDLEWLFMCDALAMETDGDSTLVWKRLNARVPSSHTVFAQGKVAI